jgi:DNA replication protein DnaC
MSTATAPATVPATAPTVAPAFVRPQRVRATAPGHDPVDAAIDEACRLLHLPTVRNSYDELAHEALRERATYKEFLSDLLAAECTHREERRKQRLVRDANFPRPKRLEDFDFAANPNVTPEVVNTLANPAWVRAGQPLCLIGDSGTGKSHLLIGIGTAIAEAGLKVRYTTTANLVNELAEAADDRQLTKVLTRYGRVDLLCLDEFGYLDLDKAGAKLLFQIFTDREATPRHRDRVQRPVLRMETHLHRPADLHRHRRPAHLQRQHHRDRHRLVPTAHHHNPPGTQLTNASTDLGLGTDPPQRPTPRNRRKRRIVRVEPVKPLPEFIADRCDGGGRPVVDVVRPRRRAAIVVPEAGLDTSAHQRGVKRLTVGQRRNRAARRRAGHAAPHSTRPTRDISRPTPPTTRPTRRQAPRHVAAPTPPETARAGPRLQLSGRSPGTRPGCPSR